MPISRSQSCSDGRCEVQHNLYRTTHATSNPAMPDIAKDSVSYGVSWYSRQKNSNQEQVCHDFKFTLEEVLKIVVERCGTEPRAGHCCHVKRAQRKAWSHWPWPRQLSATTCSAWSTEKKSNGDGQVHRCTHSPLLKGECGSSTDDRKEVQKTNTCHPWFLI